MFMEILPIKYYEYYQPSRRSFFQGIVDVGVHRCCMASFYGFKQPCEQPSNSMGPLTLESDRQKEKCHFMKGIPKE